MIVILLALVIRAERVRIGHQDDPGSTIRITDLFVMLGTVAVLCTGVAPHPHIHLQELQLELKTLTVQFGGIKATVELSDLQAEAVDCLLRIPQLEIESKDLDC